MIQGIMKNGLRMITVAIIMCCLRDIFQETNMGIILKLTGGISHAVCIQFVKIRVKNKTITNT
jgi:hypothetical protein